MAEITKTRVDLIEQAATQLGAKTSNDPLSDEDSDTIENLVDPLVQQLSLDGVVEIGDTDQIPSEYFIALANLLANAAAPSFGQQTSPDVKFANETQLRKLSATKPTGETQRGVYF